MDQNFQIINAASIFAINMKSVDDFISYLNTIGYINQNRFSKFNSLFQRI
mgnify:CR=1 FL=1